MKKLIFAEALKLMEEGNLCHHVLNGDKRTYKIKDHVIFFLAKPDKANPYRDYWTATALSGRVFLQGHWELCKPTDSVKTMKLRAYVSVEDGQIQWRTDGTKMDYFTATNWTKEVELI